MNNRSFFKGILSTLAVGLATACAPNITNRDANKSTPVLYTGTASNDSINIAKEIWKTYFDDTNLTNLIEQALQNNQELNIARQEAEVRRQEIRFRKGEYLPFVSYQAGIGVDKPGRYTANGSSEATTDIRPGHATPDPLPNILGGGMASWEIDIWRKLRNARKAAAFRYLSSVEGNNFLITSLIAEIANTYYELLAYDIQLALIEQNIIIQTNALGTVRAQKDGARVTELAVRRFEAQVLKTRSMQFDIQQRIVETENRLNFLVGRYPQPVARTLSTFGLADTDSVASGLPSQLIFNRPDIRRAEADLSAAKLDVTVARAYFKPSLNLTAALGYSAFNPAFLFSTPASIFYALIGGFAGPLVNRNGLYASFYSANARQQQTIFNYERTVLNAYVEVANQISNIRNLKSSYVLRNDQVNALKESSTIANNLFTSARADYMEVLLTQRDALESSFELVNTRMQQLHAKVAIYKALGGGWR